MDAKTHYLIGVLENLILDLREERKTLVDLSLHDNIRFYDHAYPKNVVYAESTLWLRVKEVNAETQYPLSGG